MNQYKSAMEADPKVLLKMITNQKNFPFIDQLLKNEICSFYEIVQQAHEYMRENDLDCTDDDAVTQFGEEQPFCMLLYYMIKHKITKLGPWERISPEETKNRTNYLLFAVPALLHCCNDSPRKTNESELARIVLSKLVDTRSFKDGVTSLFSYQDVRRAGASLIFFRYHLNAPEKLFAIGGSLECSADELYLENMDMLFCIRIGFPKKELISAGYDREVLEKICQTEEDDWPTEAEHLRKLKDMFHFKQEFFLMKFSIPALKMSNVFSNLEIFEYFRDYMEVVKNIDINDFTNEVITRERSRTSQHASTRSIYKPPAVTSHSLENMRSIGTTWRSSSRLPSLRLSFINSISSRVSQKELETQDFTLEYHLQDEVIATTISVSETEL